MAWFGCELLQSFKQIWTVSFWESCFFRNSFFVTWYKKRKVILFMNYQFSRTVDLYIVF